MIPGLRQEKNAKKIKKRPNNKPPKGGFIVSDYLLKNGVRNRQGYSNTSSPKVKREYRRRLPQGYKLTEIDLPQPALHQQNA